MTNVDRSWLEGLPSRESQKTLHERLCAFCRGEGPVDHPLRAVVANAATLKQVQPANDGRKKVVEIVRNTAGKLAHGFELLRLAERLLSVLEFKSRTSFRRDVSPDRMDKLITRHRRPRNVAVIAVGFPITISEAEGGYPIFK